MSAPIRVVSRRAALSLAAAGALAGGGCSVELNNPYGGADSPSPKPRKPDPDVRLAALALDHIEEAQDRIVRTVHRHRDLADEYAPTRAMHRAHAAAVVRAVPSGLRSRRRPPVPVPHSVTAARGEIAAAEKRLQHQLAALAQQARSGRFARLLASMAAAVHQRRSVTGPAA